MKFRKLNPDEIEIRVGSLKKDGSGASFLLYKDARCDMNILDESGVIWQRDHKELKGNIYCGVGVYDKEIKQFIWKWDAGAESYTEKVKGEASDSFKRACFNLGIGRELYTSPFIWIPLNKGETYSDNKNNVRISPRTSFKVSSIAYKDEKIISLHITDNKGTVRYSLGSSPEQAKKEVKQPKTKTENELIKERLEKLDLMSFYMGFREFYRKEKPNLSDREIFIDKLKAFLVADIGKRFSKEDLAIAGRQENLTDLIQFLKMLDDK